METYKNRTKEVEAVQWTGNTDQDLEQFKKENDLPEEWKLHEVNMEVGIYIKVEENKWEVVKFGDWIVKDGDSYCTCDTRTFNIKWVKK